MLKYEMQYVMHSIQSCLSPMTIVHCDDEIIAFHAFEHVWVQNKTQEDQIVDVVGEFKNPTVKDKSTTYTLNGISLVLDRNKAGGLVKAVYNKKNVYFITSENGTTLKILPQGFVIEENQLAGTVNLSKDGQNPTVTVDKAKKLAGITTVQAHAYAAADVDVAYFDTCINICWGEKSFTNWEDWKTHAVRRGLTITGVLTLTGTTIWACTRSHKEPIEDQTQDF